MTLADARALWHVADRAIWEDALARYPHVIAAQNVIALVEIDAWYRQELPAQIAGRQPAWIELRELIGVVQWKMKRGEWRARNLVLVKGNTDAAVRSSSQTAFEAAPELRRALAAIGELAGVGPATASAVLAAYRPDLFPFLDDRVAAAIPDIGEARFTARYYLSYTLALRRRAEALGTPWTAQSVGLALWAASGGKATGRPAEPHRRA